MTWNNGLERMKFEAAQVKLAAEYRAAGISEEQIRQMYEFNLEVFTVIAASRNIPSSFRKAPLKMATKGRHLSNDIGC